MCPSLPLVDAPATDLDAVPFWPPAPRVDPEVTAPLASSRRQIERDAATIVDAALHDEAPTIVDALSDVQRAILDFERQWWRQPGAKEQAIRDTFSMSPTRYYQTLNALLDLPGALSYDAPLIHRLQRLRNPNRGRRILD
jgi:hypothetical protein